MKQINRFALITFDFRPPFTVEMFELTLILGHAVNMFESALISTHPLPLICFNGIWFQATLYRLNVWIDFDFRPRCHYVWIGFDFHPPPPIDIF